MNKIVNGCKIAERLRRRELDQRVLDESFRQVKRDMIMGEFRRLPLIPTKMPLIVAYA